MPAGTYTLHLDGRIAEGIEPVVRGMARLDAPLERTVLDRLACPARIAGRTDLYLVTVVAGRMPPVARLSDLRRDSPHVITLHTARVSVEARSGDGREEYRRQERMGWSPRER
jgi:hypothetical protein